LPVAPIVLVSIGAKQAKNGKSVIIMNRRSAAMLVAPIMAIMDLYIYIYIY
jgi:hypothetical protein